MEADGVERETCHGHPRNRSGLVIKRKRQKENRGLGWVVDRELRPCSFCLRS